MFKRILSVVVSFFLTISFVSLPDSLAGDSNDTKETLLTAPNGVSISGIDVSGMSEAQINNVISSALTYYDDVLFTLIAEGEQISASGADVSIESYDKNLAKKAAGYGVTGNIIERYMANSDIDNGRGKDFSLDITANTKKLARFIEENSPLLETAPINNSIKRQDGGFVFVEGKAGTIIDYDSSANKIADFLATSWSGGNVQIDLDVIKKEPSLTRDELMQVKDLLGSYKTNFSESSDGRVVNIKTGTSYINESLILPGEEFSIDEHLHERTPENGYEMASAYENGTTVDTYGGGICQISSTLYNAVLASELEVVKRYPHSMVVSYVEPSRDAAISSGIKDFIFKNNTEYPIYIEGYTSGNTLYFNVFGKETRSGERSVSYESEIVTTTDPEVEEKFVADDELAVGAMVKRQGVHTGYTARLWKIVKENGEEVERTVWNNSTYSPSPAIYSVGVSGDPGMAEAIRAAIASGDRAVIEATLGIAKPEEPTEG